MIVPLTIDSFLENKHEQDNEAIRLTRCVCETLMPLRRPFFEKPNMDIRP